jgi:peptidylprolyl isomerase
VKTVSIAGVVAFGLLSLGAAPAAPPSMTDILAASPHGDWRPLDPSNLLILQLPAGRVTIELAPAFAPQAVANIKALVRAHYFDGSFVVRAQDNYVVQWARGEGHGEPHTLGGAKAKIPAEFDRSATGLAFTSLADPDTYAPQTGFAGGFPVARDPAHDRAWLTHCYGMVGVGRDVAADSGNGSELYAVIGQSPRNLDRNVTLVGRVVDGIERFSVLPRGTAALGFYAKPEQRIPIASIRLASDIPAAERPKFEALRTDSKTFATLLQERRMRPDPWYKNAPGHIGVCNMPLPVRAKS